MERATATHAPSSPVPLPARIGSSSGMSSRLPKSARSDWLTNQVEFLINAADTRLPNEMHLPQVAASLPAGRLERRPFRGTTRRGQRSSADGRCTSRSTIDEIAKTPAGRAGVWGSDRSHPLTAPVCGRGAMKAAGFPW